MGVLADRLDSMRIRVASPNKMVVAELCHRTEVRLSFASGAYQRSYERGLEEQLAGLARVMWAARMKGYYQAVSEAFGEEVTGEPLPVGRRDQEYLQARDQLVAVGRSRDGRVQLAVRGMRTWTVRIADGSLRALSEDEFTASVGEAAGALIRDQFDKIRQLKLRVYEEPAEHGV